MSLLLSYFKKSTAFVIMMNAVIVYAQPRIQFINTEVNVGEIYEGEMPEVKYVYKNIGNQPLRVTQVKSSCGCYSPSWEKDSTPPGETDTIRAKYSSVAHLGGISKSIYVVTNTGEKDIELMIRGSVKTFVPDLHLYSGGSPMVIFDVEEDLKTGTKDIVFHAPKGSKEKGPVTLVFANKVDKEKEVAIVLDSIAKQTVGLRVLKSELANNKLAYISPDKFFITKKDTEILYINILQEKNVQFNVLIDTQPVSVSLLFD